MQAPTRVQHVYNVRNPFKTFHARTQRLAILVYHRRAGKTVATVNDLVAKALKCRKKNGHFAYLAPFMGQVEQTAWAYLKDAVRNIPGHRISETKKFVEVPSAHGSFAKIRLFGADNPDSLRGLYFDGIVLDEVADMKSSVWTEVIQPALMDRGGWAVFIGTPKGKNFFYDLWEKAKKEPEKWFSQILRASESGLLPSKALEEYRDEVDEETYQQEMECSFTAGIKGAYWASLIDEMSFEGRLEPIEIVKAAPVGVVFDLGWDDATAAWFYQIINGELRVIDHDEWNQINMETITQDVLGRGYKMGDWWMPHDAKAHSLQTGKSMIEFMEGLGIYPQVVPKLGPLDGIQAVRQTLPKMRIDGTKCYQGVEALKAYKKKWNAERQAFQKTPDHNWASHTADAMRYLCLAVSDADLAASKPVKRTSMSSYDSQVQWLAQASINKVANNGMTFDEAFSRQPRSSYVERI